MAEVLSPATEPFDRGPKREAYGLMGVAWLWILDPDTRTVETFSNVRGRMTPGPVFASGDEVLAPPFEAADLRGSAFPRGLTRGSARPARSSGDPRALARGAPRETRPSPTNPAARLRSRPPHVGEGEARARMNLVTYEQILRAVRALPSPEQIAVAREILLGVEAEEGVSEAECEVAWAEEVSRRRRTALETKAAGIPAEEVFARARAAIRS